MDRHPRSAGPFLRERHRGQRRRRPSRGQRMVGEVFLLVAKLLGVDDSVRRPHLQIGRAAIYREVAAPHDIEGAAARLDIRTEKLHLEALGRKPRRDMLGLGPHLEHLLDGRIEAAMDEEGVLP